MPIDPRYLTIEHWSSLTAATLKPFGDIPVTTSEADWTTWARAVKNLPALASSSIPSPTGFTDWRLWGFRLNQALANLGL